MISALTAFMMAVAVVVVVTPFVRRFALDVGAVDRPGERRRVNARVIPRLGGMAIVVGFLTPLLVLFGIETEVARQFFAEPLRVVGLVAGSLVVTAVGVFDDVRGVTAWRKLSVQLIAALIAYVCGYRIEAVAIPGMGHLDMGIFALPVTALWIVAIVNAINLIDGLDGLAGGIAFFACITNFVVGTLNHDVLVMLLSAALGGAVLGFLLFNFNPASIFMGDSGSLFLGFVLATTSIAGNYTKGSTAVAILVPLIALGLPIVDTLFAMARRFLERRPIFSPDRGHIHHRLLAMGINHRRAVLVLYGFSILLTSGAILVAMGRRWQIGGALLVLSIAVFGLVRGFGSFQQVALVRLRRRERLYPAVVERLRAVVPTVLQRVAGLRQTSAVASCLQELVEQAELTSVEIASSEHPELPSIRFERPRGAERFSFAPAQHVAVSFPVAALGPSARIVFELPSDQDQAPTEAEILLLLVVDACAARIGRAAAARERVSRGLLRPL